LRGRSGHALRVIVLSHFLNCPLGQQHCFIRAEETSYDTQEGREKKSNALAGGHDMELKTASSQNHRFARPVEARPVVNARPVNECAQCRETIFLPEWSEYLDARRVRHLWECEACGYKFETLVCFPA
jgi:hypothetical protein